MVPHPLVRRLLDHNAVANVGMPRLHATMVHPRGRVPPRHDQRDKGLARQALPKRVNAPQHPRVGEALAGRQVLLNVAPANADLERADPGNAAPVALPRGDAKLINESIVLS